MTRHLGTMSMFSVRVLVRDIREELIVFVLRMLPFTIQYMHHSRGHNISLIYKTKNYISVMIMLVPEYSCTKLRRHTHMPHSNILHSFDINTAWYCTDFHFPCIHRLSTPNIWGLMYKDLRGFPTETWRTLKPKCPPTYKNIRKYQCVRTHESNHISLVHPNQRGIECTCQSI